MHPRCIPLFPVLALQINSHLHYHLIPCINPHWTTMIYTIVLYVLYRSPYGPHHLCIFKHWYANGYTRLIHIFMVICTSSIFTVVSIDLSLATPTMSFFLSINTLFGSPHFGHIHTLKKQVIWCLLVIQFSPNLTHQGKIRLHTKIVHTSQYTYHIPYN